MEALIQSITAAVTADATPEVRAAGAVACRTILAALEATPGAQLVSPVAVQAAPNAQIAALVSSLRGTSPDQLLDLAIMRLRAALPAGTEVPSVQPLKFHIVPPPPRG